MVYLDILLPTATTIPPVACSPPRQLSTSLPKDLLTACRPLTQDINCTISLHQHALTNVYEEPIFGFLILYHATFHFITVKIVFENYLFMPIIVQHVYDC